VTLFLFAGEKPLSAQQESRLVSRLLPVVCECAGDAGCRAGGRERSLPCLVLQTGDTSLPPAMHTAMPAQRNTRTPEKGYTQDVRPQDACTPFGVLLSRVALGAFCLPEGRQVRYIPSTGWMDGWTVSETLSCATVSTCEYLSFLSRAVGRDRPACRRCVCMAWMMDAFSY